MWFGSVWFMKMVGSAVLFSPFRLVSIVLEEMHSLFTVQFDLQVSKTISHAQAMLMFDESISDSTPTLMVHISLANM